MSLCALLETGARGSVAGEVGLTRAGGFAMGAVCGELVVAGRGGGALVTASLCCPSSPRCCLVGPGNGVSRLRGEEARAALSRCCDGQ